jgi:hypothetical protein
MADPLPSRVLDDLVSIVQGLNLTGAATAKAINGNALKQMFLSESLVQFPVVVVTPAPEPEDEGDHNLEEDTVGYKGMVLVCDRNAGRDATPLPDYLAWRRQIIQTFRALERLPSCPEVWNLTVRRLPVLDQRLPEYQFVVSGCTVTAWANEARPKNDSGGFQ